MEILRELREQFSSDGNSWRWIEGVDLDEVAPKAAAYFKTIPRVDS